MQIIEIVDVGGGWNKVRLADGNTYTLKGTYAWRSNNPGNIEYGDFARSMGAIGQGAPPPGRQRGFAIFPTLDHGQRAREVLQFERPAYLNADNAARWGHSYPAGSIGAAIYRYAPPTENDTEGYIRQIVEATGLPASTKMSALNADQRAAFMAAQQRHEGFTQGEIYNSAGIRLPPAEIPNIVGTELDTKQGIAARVNAALDRLPPTPAPRSDATVARTNAMLQRPRPMDMPDSVREARAIGDAPPVPRPVSERPSQQPARMPASGARQLLPTIGPTGTIQQDPVGAMPSQQEMADFGAPQVHRRPVTRAAADLAARPNSVTPQLAPGNEDILSYHLPDQTPTTVTGGLGSLTPRPEVETKPNTPPPGRPGQSGMAGQERGPITAPRAVTRRASTFAAQDAAPPKPASTIMRVAAQDPSTQAGNVAMPAGARPAVADALIKQAEDAAQRQRITTNGGSFAGQERGPVTQPPAARPPSYAGQERIGTQYPSDAARVEGPPASPSRSQLVMADQSYAGQDRAPGLTARPKPAAQSAQAASPAEVPKYITTTERVAVPQTWKASDLKPAATGAIPLGDVRHTGSRDSVASRKQGEADAAAAPSERYTTRTVTTLNPEWVRQQPVTQPAKQAPKAPVETQQPTVIGGIRQQLGIPQEGFGPGILRGFQSAFGLGQGNGAVRRPLTGAQVVSAQRPPQNHNAAALAAISEGRSSYDPGGGALNPTRAMNGNVRNTYGDSSGNNGSISSW